LNSTDVPHPPSDSLTRAKRFARSPGPAPATSSLKRTQASITSARKVFRILKPLEMLMPIYQNPSLDWRKPLHVEVLKKLKCLCMALYFGMDHVVWMKQAGLIVKDIQSYQKASMLGWLGGSCWCVSTTLLVRSSDDSRPTTRDPRLATHDSQLTRYARSPAPSGSSWKSSSSISRSGTGRRTRRTRRGRRRKRRR